MSDLFIDYPIDIQFNSILNIGSASDISLGRLAGAGIAVAPFSGVVGIMKEAEFMAAGLVTPGMGLLSMLMPMNFY